MRANKTMFLRFLVIVYTLALASFIHFCEGLSPMATRQVSLSKHQHDHGGPCFVTPFTLDKSQRKQSSRIFLSQSLIPSTDTWGNIAAMTGTATLAQFLGKYTRVGRLLGPPVTAMALAFTFASTGLLAPGGTPAAKTLQLLSLQLATPLLLLGADLRDCASRCGPLLQAFLWAAFATLVASTVGWCVCSKMLQRALGKDGLIIAAALLAKNVGGGINYIAVCRSLSASPPAVAAGLCVDNLFALVYFPVTSALAAGRPDVEDETTSTSDSSTMDSMEDQPITVQQTSIVLSLAAMATWIGERIGGPSGALPCCTVLTVFLASYAPTKWMQPLQPAAHVLGTCCLYLFFATAGAPGVAVAESVRASLIPLGLFLTILYGIHGGILTLCHRLGRRGQSGAFIPQRLLVASSAAIGGPATAAALAQANQWDTLFAPSLLVGNIGYAVATFVALAFFTIFSTP